MSERSYPVPRPSTVERSPAVESYRQGLQDGRVDALAEVLAILDGVLPAPGTFADAYREIRALYAGAALRAGQYGDGGAR